MWFSWGKEGERGPLPGALELSRYPPPRAVGAAGQAPGAVRARRGGSEEANSALFLVDVKKKTKGLNDVAPTEALGKGFYQGVNWK